jgi:hypothetical protein
MSKNALIPFVLVEEPAKTDTRAPPVFPKERVS